MKINDSVTYKGKGYPRETNDYVNKKQDGITPSRFHYETIISPNTPMENTRRSF